MYCPECGAKCNCTDKQYNPVYCCPACKVNYQYLAEMSGGPVYAVLSEDMMGKLYPCPLCGGNSDKCGCP